MIVNRDEKRGRATSFAGVADAYERARPGYPLEAVRWLAGETPADVVDLGAGTGKLTRSLVELGHRVTAVEPLPEMLDHLRAAAPQAKALLGTAEEIALPDASADAVVCAQAFHWFDAEKALAEIARVLRPAGRVALVWNTRDDVEPWVRSLSETIGSETVESKDGEEPIARSGLFGPVERATFRFTQRLGRDELVDLVRSRSYCAVMDAGERQRVLERVVRLYDDHAGSEGIELPYRTECFRAERR